nr:hypothetical protein [Tanacetum cinerariifolium]
MRLVTHSLEGYKFEKTCNNDKNLSKIQLENEKEVELVAMVVNVVHECRHWMGSGYESFWEEGDDFRVDVLCFHTCLIDILVFLEKLKWWFKQDIDDEEDGGSDKRDRCSSYDFHEEGFDRLQGQHWTRKRCFEKERKSWNEMILYHLHQWCRPMDEMRMYDLKECSSCEALYTESCGCSTGGFIDKFVCDPNKTPDSSQRPPHDCLKCRNPVDGLHCRQCALLRKKLKEDPGKNSSQSPPHIDHHCCCGCEDSLDGIFCQRCTCESCGSSAHYGYNCPPKVPIISNPKPCHNQNVDEFLQTLPSFHPTCYSGDENSFAYDPTPNFVDDSPNVSNPPSKHPMYSYEFCGNDTHYSHDYEFIKSGVENLIPNPSESEDLYNIGRECDVPVCDGFTTFSNLFFDVDEFSSSDDKLFSDEDIPKEIYSNPLFDEEIISIKIDLHHFNAESDLIQSMLNQDSSIISSYKIDSLFDEFAGELIFLKSIPPGIDEADCDPEEEICLIEKLFYDNLSPRPLEEFNSENSDAIIESFSPSPMLVEDSNPFMKEIDCFLLLMDQYPQVLIVTTQTPKGIIFFQKDYYTMILFPFRTFLTPQMSSEIFLPSSPIR